MRDGVAASESLTASHPFFWAGYMLVDSGASSAQADPAAPVQAPVASADAKPPSALLPMGLGQPAADAPPDDAPPQNKRTGAK